MTESFTWISTKSSRVSTPLVLRKDLQEKLESVFGSTFDPKENRKEWFKFLGEHTKLKTALGVLQESDLSLMLPPSVDVHLPILRDIREALSKVDANAASYPYSARSANEIKTLVMDYEACLTKIAMQQQKQNEKKAEQKTYQDKIATLKRQLINKEGDRDKALKEISSTFNLLKSVKIPTVDSCETVLNKLRRIFKAKASWKLRAKNVDLYDDILDAISESTMELKANEPAVVPRPFRGKLLLPDGIDLSTNEKYIDGSWKEFLTFNTRFETELQKELRERFEVDLKASTTIYLDSRSGAVRCSVPWNNNFRWQEKLPYHSRMSLENTPWKTKSGALLNFPAYIGNYSLRLAFKKADNSIVGISNCISGQQIQNKLKSFTKTVTAKISDQDQERITRKANALVLRGYTPGMVEEKEQSIVFSFIRNGKWNYGDMLSKELCAYLEPPKRKQMVISSPRDLGSEYDIIGSWDSADEERFLVELQKRQKQFKEKLSSIAPNTEILDNLKRKQEASALEKVKRNIDIEMRRQAEKYEKDYQERIAEIDKQMELRRKEKEASQNRMRDLLETIQSKRDQQDSLQKDIADLKKAGKSTTEKEKALDEIVMPEMEETKDEEIDFEAMKQKAEENLKQRQDLLRKEVSETLIQEVVRQMKADSEEPGFPIASIAPPADLRFGGGYIEGVKPPVGLFLFKDAIYNTGSELPEIKDGTITLYDKDNNDTIALAENVQPILNNNIYLWGEDPSTMMIALEEANGEEKIKYFGLQSISAAYKQEITYDLPYEKETYVNVQLDSTLPHSIILDNLCESENNVHKTLFNRTRSFNGFLKEVHICDAKSSDGMISKNSVSMLMADVDVMGIMIRNIPFKYIRKVYPKGEKVQVYYETSSTYGVGYTSEELRTMDDHFYVLDERVKKCNKVIPILPVGTNVLCGEKFLKAKVESFSDFKYKVSFNDTEVNESNEFSTFDVTSTEKYFGPKTEWIESQRIGKYVVFFTESTLKDHKDKYYGDTPMPANISIDRTVKLNGVDIDMNGMYSVKILSIGDDKIVTDKGEFTFFSMDYIHVPRIFNYAATELIVDSLNVQPEMMVQNVVEEEFFDHSEEEWRGKWAITSSSSADEKITQTGWASDSSDTDDLSGIINNIEKTPAWATDDESD